MMVTHGSLFSGIGGFDLAAEWMGWENVLQVEKDDKCQLLLKQNFPNVKKFKDIKEFDGNQFKGTIDILSGGPPCQPTSLAGKREGENDDRWLWPEAIRVFGEIKPGIGVFENPDDLLTLDNGKPFERICSSLEDFGYKVETYGIPAACVGAWHQRDRVWIITYSNSIRWDHEQKEIRKPLHNKVRNGKAEKQSRDIKQCRTSKYIKILTNTDPPGLQESAQTKFRGVSESNESFKRCQPSGTPSEIGGYWETEPGVVRMVHGLSNRVDRIKGLGNAIVPQVAYQIFKAIDYAMQQDHD